MSKLRIAEAAQFPMARHAAEIGWTALAPENTRAIFLSSVEGSAA
jgi:hypothetical protein